MAADIKKFLVALGPDAEGNTSRAMTAVSETTPNQAEPIAVDGAVAEAQDSTYKVVEGDTLYGIAAKNPFTVDELIASNPGINPDKLSIGQGLVFPSTGRQAGKLSESTVVKATEAATVEEAVESVAEEVSQTNPLAVTNPVQFIFDKGYIGLNEGDADDRRVIKSFFDNSLGGNQTFATAEGASSVAKGSRAWCATFVDHVFTELGVSRLASSDPYDRVRAKQYENIGDAVELGSAKEGDVVVKRALDSRGRWQYHVGFYVGTEKSIATGDTDNATALQQGLLDAGFDPKGVDGIWGKGSQAALEAYQKDKGLAVGPVTPELFKEITGQEGNLTENILMLGGNQSNSVNVAAYPVSSVTAIRRIGDVASLDKATFDTITEDISYGKGTR